MKEITTQLGMKATIDPLKAYEGIKDDKLLAATGLLPYFAAEVYLTQPESVSEAFSLLMECYGMGYGQDGSGWGTVVDRVYKSEHEEDEDRHAGSEEARCWAWRTRRSEADETSVLRILVNFGRIV